MRAGLFFRIYLVLFIILSEKCQSHVGHFQARQQLGDPYLCVKLPLAWSLVLTAKHAAEKTQREVDRGLAPDVVVSQSEAVLETLARKVQHLLVRREALLFFDLVTRCVCVCKWVRG